MKISLHWIEELLGTKLPYSVKEISEILLQAGFSTASIETYAKSSGIKVAEILEIRMHPNADRLRIAKVTDQEETLEVVCGASNIQVGQKVFWAKVGSCLPDGTLIKKTSIRNVPSPGMLCSNKELGVGQEASGIWILDPTLPVGSSLEDHLQLEDSILDLELTPNRPDCLSHIGIARELSALLNLRKPSPHFQSPNHYRDLKLYLVEIEDPLDCPRYLAKKLEGILPAFSPLMMQSRLQRLGIRPIHYLVDVTNSVLLEMGQPLHVFDADKIEGEKIIVRRAKKGEKILALDGKIYTLNPEILVIADVKKPIAIAGIMGGEETAVTPSTKNILLESAVFNPKVIRKGKNLLDLSSESSYRFERGVSSWSAWNGSAKAEYLLQQGTSSRTTQFADTARPENTTERSTVLPFSKIEKILGMKIELDQIKSIFQKLDIEIISLDQEKCLLSPPQWRLDLTEDMDYMEEIARIVGYGNIPSKGTQIRLPTFLKSNAAVCFQKKIKTTLQALGFFEVCNYGLIPEKDAKRLFHEDQLIYLENPLSEEQAVLRPTLVLELLKNLKQNASYQKKQVQLFEMGTVFEKKNHALTEKNFVAGVAYGLQQPSSWKNPTPLPLDFFWLKGVLEQLFKSLGISDFELKNSASLLFHPSYGLTIHAQESMGSAGVLHPQWAKALDLPKNTVLFEIDLDGVLSGIQKNPKILPPLRTPFIKRDCSILVNKAIPWEDLRKEIEKIGGSLLEECVLFDLYEDKKDPEKKSLSFTLTFRSPEKTLEDETVNQIRDSLFTALHKKFKTELRK
jgi:phenylalanyl-tRNA synthetase beta chain